MIWWEEAEDRARQAFDAMLTMIIEGSLPNFAGAVQNLDEVLDFPYIVHIEFINHDHYLSFKPEMFRRFNPSHLWKMQQSEMGLRFFFSHDDDGMLFKLMLPGHWGFLTLEGTG